MQQPYVMVIAGPNGSGKSTLVQTLRDVLPNNVAYVDPDAFVSTTSKASYAVAQIRAGRAALQCMDDLIRRRVSIVIESTLSGKTLALRLAEAARLEYTIHIVLLQLQSVETTVARVRNRVEQGGHDITHNDQLRRFDRCYANFASVYVDVCHTWSIYNAEHKPPRRMATGRGSLTAR